MTAWLGSRWPGLAWLYSPWVDNTLVLVFLAISLADVWMAAYLVCLAIWGP